MCPGRPTGWISACLTSTRRRRSTAMYSAGSPRPPCQKSAATAVFGWVTQDMPMGAFSYTIIRPAGGGEDSSQGGIMPLSPEMTAAGMSTRWRAYFEVADCDLVVAKAAERGGTVTAPAEDIPG